MLDVVIIGAGPVGIFAAFNAGMHNLNGVLVEGQSYVGGQLTTIYSEKIIYDAPGITQIKASDYIYQLFKQYEQFQHRVPLYLNEKFFTIETKENHFIVKTAQQTFTTKSVLITVGNGGFNPRKLSLKDSSEYDNIIYLIKSLAEYQDKDMIILGGGDSAFDWANMLNEVARSVTLVHRRRDFRAHQESINIFREKGKIFTPYIADQIIGTPPLLKGLKIRNVEDDSTLTLDADYVLVNFGFLPSLIQYENFNLKNVKNGIIVNEDMSTSQPGIFAAGNCVSYRGKLKTIASGLGEAVTAVNAINNYLYPQKHNLPIYSSLLMNKKK